MTVASLAASAASAGTPAPRLVLGASLLGLAPGMSEENARAALGAPSSVATTEEGEEYRAEFRAGRVAVGGKVDASGAPAAIRFVETSLSTARAANGARPGITYDALRKKIRTLRCEREDVAGAPEPDWFVFCTLRRSASRPYATVFQTRVGARRPGPIGRLRVGQVCLTAGTDCFVFDGR